MIKKNPQRTDTADRRKEVRLNKTFEVSLCPSKYLLQTNALSRDISEDGICLISPYKMDIGEIIELGVQLPELKKPSLVTGEVVRRNESDDPKFPYLMGVKFVKIEEDLRRQIQEHMRFYMVER